MTTPFAQAQANAGAAVARLLANATLTADGVSADGHYNRHAIVDQETQAVGITFTCETEHLDATIDDGADVAIAGAGHRVRTRTDSAATGLTTLVLART